MRMLFYFENISLKDQFMEFVSKYREKFGSKLDLFRQLMLQHQLDTQQKEKALTQQVEVCQYGFFNDTISLVTNILLTADEYL